MGLQRVRHDWATELNWTEASTHCEKLSSLPPHPPLLVPPELTFHSSPHHLLQECCWPLPGHDLLLCWWLSLLRLLCGIPFLLTLHALHDLFFPLLFFKKKFKFNWRLITLYNIVVVFAIHSHESAMGVHVLPSLTLSPTSLPIPSLSAAALSTLSHVLNLDWSSISHMIIEMFQCYSLKSSHPCLLLPSPKVCSLHLCLFCCLAYRVIITIFLNSIYMH